MAWFPLLDPGLRRGKEFIYLRVGSIVHDAYPAKNRVKLEFNMPRNEPFDCRVNIRSTNTELYQTS